MKELNMRIERINNDWTLDYVGIQLGITKQSVLQLETGKSKPSYDVLCNMEKLFKKSHSYLLAVSKNDTPINQKKCTTKGGSK